MKISAGTLISADMLVCKSPGYGLKPGMLKEVVGKRVKIDLDEDTVIIEDHIVWKFK